MTDNIQSPSFEISRSDRSTHKKHNSFVLWSTGLSGSGKSTLADLVEKHLMNLGVHTYILDGDNIRKGLNKDLGFSNEDRTENIRRIGEVSSLFVDAGIVVISSFISPFQKDRAIAAEAVGEDRFIEVYINAPLEVCEKRDPKGLYKKARDGVITDFTGVSSPYEAPVSPDVEVRTDELSKIEAAASIIEAIKS
ncbi:MAG: adenylyl-sulfate kinase, partial [Crocinitomicaceae bacterium]|nr:adenylyl-sulfate kinase [Crocinitomicaceae bacterium]